MARRRRAGARGRESARAAPAPAARRGGSRESAPGSGRSRRALRGAPVPCRRTGGCPSRRRRGGSAGATMSSRSGSANASGSRLAAPMPIVTGVRGASATPPISVAQVVIRLPSWFELSKRRNSSTAVRISAGSASRRAFCSGQASRHARPLPIRLVVVSWPALSRKMQLCSSSARAQRLAAFAVRSGASARRPRGRPARHGGARPGLRGSAELAHRAVAALELRPRSAPARARRGSPATSRAAAPAPRSAPPAGCR